MDDSDIALAFTLIAEYAIELGARSIGQLDGCWERQIDEHWWVAINGHAEPVICSRGAPVPELHCYIEYDGWPAGAINAFNGLIAAGEKANEQTFIAAVRRAKSALEGRSRR